MLVVENAHFSPVHTLGSARFEPSPTYSHSLFGNVYSPNWLHLGNIAYSVTFVTLAS